LPKTISTLKQSSVAQEDPIIQQYRHEKCAIYSLESANQVFTSSAVMRPGMVSNPRVILAAEF
jgi:hypothetical protein